MTVCSAFKNMTVLSEWSGFCSTQPECAGSQRVFFGVYLLRSLTGTIDVTFNTLEILFTHLLHFHLYEIQDSRVYVNRIRHSQSLVEFVKQVQPHVQNHFLRLP